MNDMPTAVINGASLGALRNGRYATRSIITLSTPEAAIATNRVRNRPKNSRITDVSCVSPMKPKNAAVANEPIMKTSPWAKLISSTMP
jgi:hypothetical protein